MFGFFCAKVEFQEDVNEAIVVNGPFLYGFKEVEGVYGLDKVNVRKDHLELVGLEVAYEVPLNVLWHLGHLGGQFLGAVFTKDALTGIIGFHEPFYRMELGHGHKLHPLGQSAIQLL